MQQVLAELCDDPESDSGPRPQAADSETFEPWALQEWRRISIPDWRRILSESAEQGDADREAYARWMLREVLLDPDYCELDG